MLTIVHEMSKQGSQHRLRTEQKNGEWVSYTNLAQLKVGKRLFYGVTDFYAGVLPQIFEVGKQSETEKLTLPLEI